SNAGDSHAPGAPPPAPAAAGASAPAAPPRPIVSEAEALRPRDDLPPERRVLAVVGGQERWIDGQAAEGAGFTLVDLSDDWTPYIFAEQTAPDGTPLANRYRRIFIGEANDQLDNDG